MIQSTFKIRPDLDYGTMPSKLIPTRSFTGDDTTETTTAFYRNEDGSVASGLWECAPCLLEIESYPVNEMMTIISGSVTITNSDGVEEVFGPGEVVFATKGASMKWHITEHLKKYFMTAA